MGEKTEQATPKKLRDARRKGQVAKSEDFPSAITFIAGIGLTLGTADYIYTKMGSYFVAVFRMSASTDIQTKIGGLMSNALTVIIAASLPIAGIVAALGILTRFLITGPVFSTEVFKPNFKKFNPVENIKQKFKFQTVFELLKSTLKLLIAGILIYYTMKEGVKEIIQVASLPLMGSVLLFKELLIRVVIRVGIFFIIVALFDLIYQKLNFAKQMKMEKFEIKQEYKDTEGNPEIKSKRRSIAQEIAYQDPTSAVRRSKALITNPTHIAIAIGYEPEQYSAPFILAKGMNTLAEKMIQEALTFNIPIMRDVPLARKLFETGQVMQYIPEDTYEAVAEILRTILAEAPGEFNPETS